MAAKLHLRCALVFALASCSTTLDTAVSGDDSRVEPKGLRVTPLEGGNGVLEVVALTLRRGPAHTEIYATLRNEGEIPACSAAFSVELYDAAGNSLAAGISGLLTGRFYRLTDGSGAIAACVGPGDLTVGAITDLPSDFAAEDVGHIVYRTPYFALDVVPIDGVAIRRLTSTTDGTVTTYRGTLVNALDVAVSRPSVTVFPVNRAGRPLGSALGSGNVEIPPGGSWKFETAAVRTVASDHLAFPAGALGD